MKNKELKFKLLHIELCSSCNLKCIHCFRTQNDYPSKNYYISLKLFKKIIDEVDVVNGKISLQLQGLGEPTLHPDFVAYLKYAKESEKFLSILITTNLLATNVARFKEFFYNGLSLVNVSIDSFNSKTLELTRKGTNSNKLKNNLKILSNIDNEKMQVTTVASEININELEEIATELVKYNIKVWVIQPLIEWNNLSSQKVTNNIYVLQKISKILNRFGDKIKILTTLENDKKRQCSMPFDIMHINARGYVMPCCIYWDERVLNFGNVEDENIYKLFNSDDFGKFREEFFQNKHKICKECDI